MQKSHILSAIAELLVMLRPLLESCQIYSGLGCLCVHASILFVY